MSGEARLVHIQADGLTDATSQTSGMSRTAAVSRATVGSEHVWMGLTIVDAGASSAAHHHGRCETGIFVVDGHPTFSFRDGDEVIEIRTSPGDFVFVPPFVPHIESNGGSEPARVVIARSTDEAIVENLDHL